VVCAFPKTVEFPWCLRTGEGATSAASLARQAMAYAIIADLDGQITVRVHWRVCVAYVTRLSLLETSMHSR
jgi:hypothetical protein